MLARQNPTQRRMSGNYGLALLLILGIVLFSMLSCGDGKESIPVPHPSGLKWNRTFGGHGDDTGFSIAQTLNGGFIIVGSRESSEHHGAEVYLIKTDESGNEKWSQTFGGRSWAVGVSVEQTLDEGFIICGLIESSHYDRTEVYLIKTDDAGIEEWSKRFLGKGSAEGHGVRQTSDGGYIIAGSTEAPGSDDADIYLIKTDVFGNRQWDKTLGSGDDEASCIQETSDGGFVVVGETEHHDEEDVYLLKIDELGNEEWSRTFGGPEEDEGFWVEQTSDGGFIVIGVTESFGTGEEDVYLIKTDEAGNELWSRTFGGPDDDEGFSVRQTLDGGFVIVGVTESFGVDEGDVYLINTDALGNEEWSRTFGGEKEDVGISVQQIADGSFIIAGYTESFGIGRRDVYVINTE